MKIVADDKIPYLRGALEPFAEVVYLPAAETTAAAVRDADALITRTRTLCGASLLEGSAVRYIASATIGADHIDADYCTRHGIAWSIAAGCNADGVCQYLAAALFAWARKHQQQLRDLTIGIIGVGHVGDKVAALCRALGMPVLLNDPPRQKAEGGGPFVDLDRIRRDADIITFHVPLETTGEFATLQMVDDSFLSGLGKRPLLINTSRGAVFDSAAVNRGIDCGALSGVVVDCWENEPAIDLQLLAKADIGTPHIAGYSLEGKANGTMMSVRAISRFFSLGIDDWEPAETALRGPQSVRLDGRGKDQEAILADAVLATYDILADDRSLRTAPGSFEKLRDDYCFRREFGNFRIEARNVDAAVLSVLAKMGLQTAGAKP